jgi:hypothetical protein
MKGKLKRKILYPLPLIQGEGIFYVRFKPTPDRTINALYNIDDITWPVWCEEKKMAKSSTPEWWSNLVTFILLSVTLGLLGIDRFYKGEVLWGILKLISGGGFGIWYLVDICIHAYRFGRSGQWTSAEVSSAV